MYGVKIGDTVREVRARLGKPDLDEKWRPPIDRILSYPRRKLYVGFKGKGRKGRVVWMSLRSRRERLANGVGIGTTKDEAIRKFPHLTCPVEESYHCYLGRFQFGRVVTDFRWGNDGRIAVIDVGRVSSAGAPRAQADRLKHASVCRPQVIAQLRCLGGASRAAGAPLDPG